MKILNHLFTDCKIDFMRFHKFNFALSITLIIASIFLVLFKGLNFGIDFSGGILIEAKIAKTEISDLRNSLKKELKDVQIQNIEEDIFLIRISKNKNDENQLQLIQKIKEIIAKNFENVEYRKIDYVGPQVGKELINKGFLALFLSLIFLMIYIWVRFDWQFGLGGIFALIHDGFLVLGFYSLSQIEFNLTSIAAILTVIGYSINDSVVIYDRIRENLRIYKTQPMKDIINSSLNSTLSRTFLTALTTLLSLIALVIFGGEALKSFSLGAFIGIIIGVYSSVYISAPILLYLDPRQENKKS